MHRFQTLCRLQLHKLVSEQLTGDPALTECLQFAHLARDEDGDSNAATSSPFPEGGLSRRANFPVRQITKEKTTCLSQ